jgi:hypothetical protein
MSEPAANPGFDADILYGMDRAQALAETGLDSAFPMPSRTAERYGERSGIYLSVYEYPSSGRGSIFTSKDYVMVVQRGARLSVRSVPASGSQLSMDLSANGRILTGTWQSRPGATALTRRGLYGRDPADRGRQPGPQTLRWQMGGIRQGRRGEYRPVVADPRRGAPGRTGD